jgi:hypothetical protein
LRWIRALAVLAVLAACSARHPRAPQASPSTVKIEPAPARPAPPQPRSEGRVQVDVVDDQGAAYGPGPSSEIEACHRAGSTDIGWALFVVDQRNELDPRLAESDGLSEKLLECARGAIQKIDPDTFRQARFGLYLRFY